MTCVASAPRVGDEEIKNELDDLTDEERAARQRDLCPLVGCDDSIEQQHQQEEEADTRQEHDSKLRQLHGAL